MKSHNTTPKPAAAIATLLALTLALALHAATAPAARAQQTQPPPTWTLNADGHLSLDGHPQFLSGANYIPSRDWYMILKNWTPTTIATIETDMKAMRDIGVRIIRFPPLWPLLQDDDGNINTTTLDHLDELLTIAHRNNITVQVEFFTGGVDGATMLPTWAEGNIFTDPRIIARETELVTAIANRLKNNPGLFGYDYGNEIDILYRRLMRGLKIHATPAQIRDWMLTITHAAKTADPARTVAPGLASGRSPDTPFNVWNIADATDFATVHAYPYFDGTIKYDPWLGQRTLYNMNYALAYAAMAGKPVMVQENGFSEWWVGNHHAIASALRISLVGTWAQGGIAYLWWGSHDNPLDYRIPVEKNARFSQPQVLDGGIMNHLEYAEGLLDSANRPKIYGHEFKRWAALIERLGVNWRETLPTLYLLQPDDTGKGFPDKIQLTAFTLAKQAHTNVKLWPEQTPIPPDAAAVIIANIALTEKGKANIARYLNAGGTVYQSWVNDFAKNITVAETGDTLENPAFQVTLPVAGVPMRNTPGFPLFDGERLRVNVPKLKIKTITSITGPETRVLLSTIPEKSADKKSLQKQPVFTETKIGAGKYYYLAANLEDALVWTYNPWLADNSDKIYRVLRPDHPIDIDTKLVELYAKERDGEKILVLLNRSDATQLVTVYSRDAVALQNYETRAPLGAGREISITLKPGEVLIATMTGD